MSKHYDMRGYDASLRTLFAKTYKVLGKILVLEGFVVDAIAEVVTIFHSNQIKVLVPYPTILDLMCSLRGDIMWMAWLYRAYCVSGCNPCKRFKRGEDSLEIFITTLFAGAFPLLVSYDVPQDLLSVPLGLGASRVRPIDA